MVTARQNTTFGQNKRKKVGQNWIDQNLDMKPQKIGSFKTWSKIW